MLDSRLYVSANATAITASYRCFHSNAPPTITHASRLRCLECGKAFLHENTLRQHRRTRHLVDLPSPQEERCATLAAENALLEEKLQALRERIKDLQGHPHPPAGDRDCVSSSTDVSEAFLAAVPSEKVLRDVSPATIAEWNSSPKALGTGLSVWHGVGVVVPGTVQLGTLEGFLRSHPDGPPPSTEGDDVPPPRVLQFVLQTVGYKEQRPGQLRLFRNRVTVRYFFDVDEGEAPFVVNERDTLAVQGQYAMHKSFDMVSKQLVENVVVEASRIGLLVRGRGTLLPTAHPPMAEAATVPTRPQTATPQSGDGPSPPSAAGRAAAACETAELARTTHPTRKRKRKGRGRKRVD